jgi:glutamate dehydrogenase/leucine dehydrogenase
LEYPPFKWCLNQKYLQNTEVCTETDDEMSALIRVLVTQALIEIFNITGIGRELAKRLASLGAEVVAVSYSKDGLDSLSAEVKTIKTIAVDLADWDATRAAIHSAGPIDCLVNNAAHAALESFLDIKPESIDK